MDDRTIDEIRKNETALINELKQKENIINKAKQLLKEIAYGGNEDYYIEKIKNILEILDNKGE